MGSAAYGNDDLLQQAAYAVMPKGSVVIYTGAAVHGRGNNTSALPRAGLASHYNLAMLRQEENQYLACPPEITKDLPDHLQQLIGYEFAGTSFGYYADLKHPNQSWHEKRPLNWANARQSKCERACVGLQIALRLTFLGFLL